MLRIAFVRSTKSHCRKFGYGSASAQDDTLFLICVDIASVCHPERSRSSANVSVSETKQNQAPKGAQGSPSD